MGQCKACGKETKFMYCNEICGGIYRRQKRHDNSVQAKIDANKPCKICGKIITSLRKKIYCSDACERIFHNSYVRSKTIREKRVCIYCNEEFTVINHKQKNNCSKNECRSKARRDQRKEKYNLMTDVEKAVFKFGKKFPSQDTKEPTQAVLCKCPICEIMHTHIFSPAWIGIGTPRVYCDSCNNLARVRYHTSIFHDNRASL